MTTHRRSGGVILGFSIFAFAMIAGGCGAILETNQTACERGINRVLECVTLLSGFPFSNDLSVSEACERVPDTVACSQWSAFADCVALASCSDPHGPDPCISIITRLIDNGCLPSANGGVGSPNPTPGTSSCEPLTDFELCRLDNSCPDDCSE